MEEYSIRSIEQGEFKGIYKRIRKDFEEGEYAPYAILKRQLKNGTQEGLILQVNGMDAAYAICAAGHVNGFVLISLMAVFSEKRGGGIGTAFLTEIKKRFAHKKGIIVEVEKPEESENEETRGQRTKRIQFYERAGFYRIPGIRYSIWDVPMHLMALPLNASEERISSAIGSIIHEIYLLLMGKIFIHKLVFEAVAGSVEE